MAQSRHKDGGPWGTMTFHETSPAMTSPIPSDPHADGGHRLSRRLDAVESSRGLGG